MFRKLSLGAPEVYIIAIKCANFSTFCAISCDSRAHFFATAPWKRWPPTQAFLGELVFRGDVREAMEKINKRNGVGNYLLRR